MMGSEAGRGGRRMDGRVSSPPRVKRSAFFHRRAEVSSSVSCRVVPVEFCLSNARSSGGKSHDHILAIFQKSQITERRRWAHLTAPRAVVASTVSPARVDPRGRKSLSARVLASRPADSGVRSPPTSARRPERQRDSQRAWLLGEARARADPPRTSRCPPPSPRWRTPRTRPPRPRTRASSRRPPPRALPPPARSTKTRTTSTRSSARSCPRTPRSRWWSQTGAPSTPRTPRARSRSFTRSSPGCVSRSPRGSPPIRPAPTRAPRARRLKSTPSPFFFFL